MDAFEDFFNTVQVPSASYTRDAFIVSIFFCFTSVLFEFLEIFSFVNWYEAVATSVILLILTLIDTNARSQIRTSIKNIKAKAEYVAKNKFEKEGLNNEYYSGEERDSFGSDFVGQGYQEVTNEFTGDNQS